MDHFTPLSLAVSLLLLATFILCIVRLRKRNTIPSPSKSCRLPPSPTALPIVGHLHLLTDMPHKAFTRLARQLGPIIYLRLGRVPTIIVSSAHLARLVLQTHDSVFAGRPQLIAAQHLSFGCSDVTFSPYGPYWRQARRICVTELLSHRRVDSFRMVRDEEVNRMLDWVRARSGSKVNMSEALFGLSNDVLCRVAFGRRFGSGCSGLAEVMEETQALLAGFCVGDFFPGWRWVNSVSGMKRRLEQNLKELRKVCDGIINEHAQNNSPKFGNQTVNGNREDLVDVLLRVQQRSDLEVPITDDNLKALVLDMFVAGTDTTSATLEWTMTEMVRHPRVLKKAQEEVRRISWEAGEVDETHHLQHLHYMKAVVKETMRLHPPVPLLVPRESMDDCVLEGFQIPSKTRVLINAYAIMRDPKSWDNPLVYDPERFALNDNNNEFKFLPFGGGRRGCPGSSFGLATVVIALARLLFHFDWELPPEIGPQDVDLNELFGLATRKKSALVLVPTTKY